MRFSTFLSAAFVLLSLGLHASAHGYPLRVTVDGTEYAGANGPSASSDSPMREVSSNSPVTDPTSNDIICGLDAAQASSSASANPGSTLQFFWGTISGGNWFHNVGPIITYMAACSDDCSSFTPDDSTEWFKIDQQGESTDGDSSTWAQAELLDGSPATVTIPNGLKAGNYLVRHEIISLQNSVSVGGTEYYPSCLQVTVGGNDNGEPNETVHFPGAYSETDPGILGDFYTSGYTYVFPGGSVATISGSGSSSGSSSSSSSDGPTSSTRSSSPTSSTATSSASVPAASSSSSLAASPSAVPTALLAVDTPGSSSSSSPSPTNTSSAVDATGSGSCRSKKRSLRRRRATTAARANGTSSEVPSRRSMKMHRRRAAHAVSF
ncbi:hypothetical protein A7U60_g4658 [Sanghuangporus baumii]|uniref:lytic cellulose monooxygenase (C4-dehydrogenating) n=1 Tax=Sanghuangporus baumii TaxID=108892 RepID=A0A9Q5HYX1_SANBA|nr:hypothetical protein A7U60_g4658 [Sanghuangporus baumii]